MKRPDEYLNAESATLEDAEGREGMRDSRTDTRRGSEAAEPVEDSTNALIGELVAGRYQILGLLGRGGMGTVYLAEHTELKKRVALKVLHRFMSTNEEVVARFEREAVAAGRLAHPSIVAATDFGRLEDGSFYLALEYIDGRSLADLLSECGPLEERRALSIAFQINDALCTAHGAGIIHRDLKPDNVLLVRLEDGRELVKVVDFGIAKLSLDEDHQEGLTRAGLVFGTPEYMSPEQAMGHTVDARSDLYGLGMMLFEMLSGSSPFKAQEVTEMLAKQIVEPPPPLAESIAPRLRDLVSSLLKKDPDERPESAQRLAEELTEIAVGLNYSLPPPRTSAGARPEGSRPASVRNAPRSSVLGGKVRAPKLARVPVGKARIPLWIPIVALGVGGACGAGIMLMKPKQKPPETKLTEPQVVDAEAQLLAEASSGDRDAIFELRKFTTATQKELEDSGVIGHALGKGASERADSPPQKASMSAGSASELVSQQANRFFVLGRGYSIIKHNSAAIEMYREAVRLDPYLAEESELLLDVRDAILARDAVDDGLDFAVSALGAHGADIIFDVYLDHLGEAGMTPVVARAMKMARSEQLLEHATPALKVALRLEQAKYCAEYRDIIPDAAKYADDRSLQKLSALTATRGCGSQGTNDCFVCLRRDDIDLDAAVLRAKTHPSPSFLASME